MNGKQESRLGMYKDVDSHLLAFSALTSDLPEFNAIHIEFTANIGNIEKIANLQSFDKTGFAKEKKQLKDVLAMLVLDNSRKLEAFGKLKGNIVLVKEVVFSHTKLKDAKDNMITVYAQMVYDKAQENLQFLGAFGITQETQSVFLNMINSYKASIGKPRLGQKEKKDATTNLAFLFKKQDELLDKMDSLVNIINQKEPSFCNRYRELRKVVITGSGTLSMKASVKEMPAGIPLKGVRFEFIPEKLLTGAQAATTAFIKKTAGKGSLHLKNIPEGTYRIKVSKTGYIEKEMKINIIPGEMVDLKVELEKS
jgi:hypothetical protein